jgi:transcriptional regulator with XRE-family HTH domain
VAVRRVSLARQLGRRIASLRTERGLTQEGLAWDAGLESKGYLSRIESGQRLPSLTVLERLARELEVEPRDLLLFPEADDIAAAMEAVRRDGEAFARRVIEIRAGASPSRRQQRPRPRTRPRSV